MSLSLPSGLTLDQAIADLRAIINAPAEAILPADAMTLLQLGEELIAAVAKLVEKPTQDAVLTATIDAEQVSLEAEAAAKFGVK